MNLPFIQQVFVELLAATLMLEVSTCSGLRLSRAAALDLAELDRPPAAHPGDCHAESLDVVGLVFMRGISTKASTYLMRNHVTYSCSPSCSRSRPLGVDGRGAFGSQ